MVYQCYKNASAQYDSQRCIYLPVFLVVSTRTVKDLMGGYYCNTTRALWDSDAIWNL
ncbi:hypothetical protein ANAPC1_00890 [Anaplasma phagocytophilum]|uniref:Uncharacterized protein n=1 Tax=Anaplasma phagocytophilum TaxID=948 RepID=A0AA45ZHS4_ANAPH|nr:hypothetical protein ANAPC1_00890 [Anaplasma phagocytophilum]